MGFGPRSAGAAAAALAILAAGCSGGSGGGSDPENGARDLLLVDMDLASRDGVPLNTPLRMEFSEFVDPGSIRHDTVQIRLLPRNGIQSTGEFEVSGNIVTFYPQIPTRADLSDAGFQPQSTYRVTVVGHPRVNRVRAYTGRPLIRTFAAEFGTSALTSADLFTTDTYGDAPPPRVRNTNPPDVIPTAPWSVPGGAKDVPTDSSIQVVFNKVPLLPSTVTPGNVSLTMIERLGQPQNRPIQGTPILEQSFHATTLSFVPTFPLADQARYVLRIENRVTDLTGAYDVQDNAARTALRSRAESGTDPALTAFANARPEEIDPRTFLVFTTRDEPEKNLTKFLEFDLADLDQDGGPGVNTALTTASFNDAVPGAVAAVFTAAGGTGTLGVFHPSGSTTLSTNSPNAINGAFHYSQVTIPQNVTVVFTGTLPAQVLSIRSMEVAGVVGSAGGTGENGETGNFQTSTLTTARGGPGGPGGAAGGDSYFGSSTTAPGADGGDAANNGGRGGGGGKQIQTSSYAFPGGGGGGGHQHPGLAGANGAYPSIGSWNAQGGQGGPSGGVEPTSAATLDGRNFHIAGPGGGGGGAGGNWNHSTGWRNTAGAGGGGGGGIQFKSAGDIRVSGSVSARGGPGGNANVFTYYDGGGGGGGSGGAVVLLANGNLDVTGGSLDTSGGAGGSGSNWSGRGGNGGGGFIRLEDADGQVAGSASSTTLLPDFYTGRFDPTGTAADAPSVFVGTWFNLGVFDPILEGFNALDFSEQTFPGCTIRYEIQMAREDPQAFGRADTGSISVVDGTSSDPARASHWVLLKDPIAGIQNVASTLNGRGYQFLRLRISFTLKDGQKRDDPVPYVERLRIRMRY